jgi:hypothetical protein
MMKISTVTSWKMSTVLSNESSVVAEATPYTPLSTAEPTEDLDQTNQQPASHPPCDESARNRFVNFKQHTLNVWRWETISCVLTVATLIAMICTFPLSGEGKTRLAKRNITQHSAGHLHGDTQVLLRPSYGIEHKSTSVDMVLL